MFQVRFRVHFYRSSLPRAEQSMSKVLSALSVACDSALSRNGWDALNLAQLGEPMWKPSTKRLLRLKPLLIARTPLNGIQTTSIFFSKKVLQSSMSGVMPAPLIGRGTGARTDLISAKAKLDEDSRQTNLQQTLCSSPLLPSTNASSGLTMRPELRLDDVRRESLYCMEIPAAERPSTPTCAIPRLPTSCPSEVQEVLGLTDMILASTPWWSSTSGMVVEGPSPSFFNGQTPPPCM